MQMDVEKLRKMNSLAETLKKRGLASTRDDAANLAGSLVGTPEEQAFTQKLKQESVVSQPTEAGAKMERGMSEDQIRKVLQSFADQFVTEINKMGERIAQQDQRIAKYQDMLVAMQHAPKQSVAMVEQPSVASQAAESAPAVAHVEAPAHIEKEQVAVVKEQRYNQRQGNFQPSDVSIEKFFYCGNK
jgi:hypothetical protein